jgi:DNA ligase 4
MPAKLPPPRIVLGSPLLVEVFGAGFTKSEGGRHYELRFPRLTKYHRPTERSWRDCVRTDEFHKIARRAVGRDRKDKDIDDSIINMFGKLASPGAKDIRKRDTEASNWEARLGQLKDGIPIKIIAPAVTPSATSPVLSSFSRMAHHGAPQLSTPGPLLPPADLPVTPKSLKRQRIQHEAEIENINCFVQASPSQRDTLLPLRKQARLCNVPSRPLQEISQGSNHAASISIWDYAIIWSTCKMGAEIPRACQVSSLDALLDGCGWVNRERHPLPKWLRLGIILVDAERNPKSLKDALNRVKDRRSTIDRESYQDRRTIFILDVHSDAMGSALIPDAVERHALCCLR